MVLGDVRILMAADLRNRRRSLAFVRRNARRLYRCDPPPPSQIMFLAEWRQRVCGTIALDFSISGEKLPLELIHIFDSTATPLPFERREIAQFGKWWAKKPFVSLQLMHAAHVHALSQGKKVGMSEAKGPIATRVAELGMELHEVPGAVLMLDLVPAPRRAYYRSDPPRLYLFDLAVNAAALARTIESQE